MSLRTNACFAVSLIGCLIACASTALHWMTLSINTPAGAHDSVSLSGLRMLTDSGLDLPYEHLVPALMLVLALIALATCVLARFRKVGNREVSLVFVILVAVSVISVAMMDGRIYGMEWFVDTDPVPSWIPAYFGEDVLTASLTFEPSGYLGSVGLIIAWVFTLMIRRQPSSRPWVRPRM